MFLVEEYKAKSSGMQFKVSYLIGFYGMQGRAAGSTQCGASTLLSGVQGNWFTTGDGLLLAEVMVEVLKLL